MKISEMKSELLKGNRRALAKAITLIESSRDDHQKSAQELMRDILPHVGKSIRIGLSGVPGVGKSTFIEAFGLHLISQGLKVAVLAVDPSSPVSGGSLLGDKTRMDELSSKTEAFIRPSPTSGALGGVAAKTREAMLLCEAAGHDVILVETVGVGQSEVEVSSMVDLFCVLMLPNAGDDLQGIKKGILELCDVIIINKADGAGEIPAAHAQTHFQNAFQILGRAPAIIKCSALYNKGITEAWTRMNEVLGEIDKEAKRASQRVHWMEVMFRDLIDRAIHSNQELSALKKEMVQKISLNQLTPAEGANLMFKKLFKN